MNHILLIDDRALESFILKSKLDPQNGDRLLWNTQ